LAVKASANGLAGLNPSIFMNPNQKNTKKIEKRANGMNVRLKKAISLRSTSEKTILLFRLFVMMNPLCDD
jgi:hypothetical protein